MRSGYENPREIVQYETQRVHTGYIAQSRGKERAFEYRVKILNQFARLGKVLEVGRTMASSSRLRAGMGGMFSGSSQTRKRVTGPGRTLELR